MKIKNKKTNEIFVLSNREEHLIKRLLQDDNYEEVKEEKKEKETKEENKTKTTRKKQTKTPQNETKGE